MHIPWHNPHNFSNILEKISKLFPPPFFGPFEERERERGHPTSVFSAEVSNKKKKERRILHPLVKAKAWKERTKRERERERGIASNAQNAVSILEDLSCAKTHKKVYF